ncbi:MAG: TM0106 family RecB-like putative nuclease, partial [Actinomycetota bacterium]|nr:TM0106 family RecB-like putative nuclease [Actinomycetota bacterium]
LERVETPSALGGWSYEAADTKLARHSKPAHILQLCFYSEQLGRIQARLPELFHVELGTGVRETFRTADHMAHFRRSRERFLEALGTTPETYPWPCDHCGICDFRHLCKQQLRDDDNLVLVAGLRRSQADHLAEEGVPTLATLGVQEPGLVVAGMRAETLEPIRHQASLQLHRRETGEHRVDLLSDEEGRGFRLLPAPSFGDVWLDLEGHPFYEPARGLEYLFGWCYRDEDGTVRYEAAWARDREGECEIFERFVDWVVARRHRYPDAHVYHYASYERTALRRLMGEHATRENEVDDFLRGDVLVDLYRVVKQSLRASVESYSIKAIEELYEFVRTAEVRGGDESTVLFERWIESGDDSLLRDIEAYNEEDCRSTVALHEWLLQRRPPGLPWRPSPEPEPPADEEMPPERAVLRDALLARSAEEGDAPWLLAQLLDYHRREAKPQWWEWFLHVTLDEEELIADTDTIGGLELVGEPEPDRSSLVYTFTFPPQEHKISGNAIDPATEKPCNIAVDDELGLVTLRRAKNRAEEPLPRALIPVKPIMDGEQREALARLARAFRAGEAAPGVVAVLERRLPRVRLDLPPVEAVATLEDSYLFVQGPPGSGKTWQGAKMAVALMRDGKRVGVTSLSHKAINKLLQEIEREAREQGFVFRGRKKSTSGNEESRFEGSFIDWRDGWGDLLDEELQLVAGTAWLLAREDFEGHLHTLFIDEAGQVALADALAMGAAARDLVLLGDPNQLPQVSQGAQPEAAKVSVLQHLLGSDETVPPERGIFLERTWRLRPEICAFTSEAYYEGRLLPAPVSGRRSLEVGDGLVIDAIEHAGRSQSSWEEADAVAAAIRALLGTSFTDESGVARPVGPDDVLVVAPYNAQVRRLRQRLPAGVRVGTVDKFQGQEAPVVFVSMASSTAEDAPRGIGFAFDRHRVNVATSRAQCRVVLVCAPRLLDADCKSVEQMRLVNALCRFVELAR